MSTASVISWVERGRIPDPIVRTGIRKLLRQRRIEIGADDLESAARRKADFVRSMAKGPTAPVPHLANQQHYEVPAEFFCEVLGPHRKYSSCYWEPGVDDIGAAEQAALERTCRHAGIADGMRILELGCGWGSLTLWMAEKYPRARIEAVSNSASQRRYILAQAAERGLDNVEVTTADMNRFDAGSRFDRIVSVEMFEHMRNWPQLFERVAAWLAPEGRFLMHVFCHRQVPYEFVDNGPDDWMSRHFFSGGIMPSDDLPLHFQQHLRLRDQWRWNGTHYEKTANAWLQTMDDNRESVMDVLSAVYGDDAPMWFMRWRVFFMACAELFGYRDGSEWFVSHYLFERSR